MSTTEPSTTEPSTTEPSTTEPTTTTAEALKPARPPVGTGLSPLFGQLLALLLVALGVVGIQDALSRAGVLSQAPWTRSVLSSATGVSALDWMLPIFVVLVVVGLLLLLVVLKPRPRKALSVSAETGVFLRTKDLGRLAESALDGVDGVTDISTDATRRRLKVTARTVSTEDGDAALEATLKERLAPVLSALDNPPRVVVAIRHEELS